MRVSVVLDISYGDELLKLVKEGPIWAVDSPSNRAAAQIFWASPNARDHRTGITIFTPSGETCEEWLINDIGTIDEHVNEYSAADPLQLLEVYGCHLTDGIRATLSKFGFVLFQEASDGFFATRARRVVH
jgi:hypothetical protein